MGRVKLINVSIGPLRLGNAFGNGKDSVTVVVDCVIPASAS